MKRWEKVVVGLGICIFVVLALCISSQLGAEAKVKEKEITTKSIPLFGEMVIWPVSVDGGIAGTVRVYYGGLRSHESGNSGKIIVLIFTSTFEHGITTVTLDYQDGMELELPTVVLKDIMATETHIVYTVVPK